MENNPLSQYFRQPAIYVKLPSNGEYYEEGSLELTETGEYPVLPMTTIDEITYRTPDALFNGTAVVNVIQSCVPNIKNAWNMPSIDVDTVLVAIRIATFGHQLDITTQCPACQEESEYGVDLRTILDLIQSPNYEEFLDLGDLKLYFAPMSYNQMNENNLKQFEEQRILNIMQDQEIGDQEKLNQMSDILLKITKITTDALAKNIKAVQTSQGDTVTQAAQIQEWLNNVDRSVFGKVRDHILKTKESSEIKPLQVKCQDCQNEYEQLFTLDMSNFFEGAS